MLKEYQISNFKAFAGRESLPIKPITLIFGPNSSGKSSLFHSLLMLKQTIDYGENPEDVLLPKGSLVDLGSYKEFIHRHNISKPFRLKVTMDIPTHLDAALHRSLLVGGNAQTDFSNLQESILGFNTYGMGIEFSFDEDSQNIIVSRIQLFLGDELDPLAIYEHEELLGSDERCLTSGLYGQSSVLKLREVNFDHVYWRNEAAARIEEIMIFDTEFTETPLDLHMDLSGVNAKWVQDLFKRLEDSSGSSGVEAKVLKREFLELHNFLPRLLNSREMQDIMFYPDSSSGSLSLLTLSASHLLRHTIQNILFIGPLRAYPDRYYTFSGTRSAYVGKHGNFVPDILVSNREILVEVNKVFDRFCLGLRVKISCLSDKDSDIHGLFGLRLFDVSTGVSMGITDVGFGVSQILPIIVQTLLSKEKTMLIEQPELHLHPRLQAELGDLFIASALGNSKNTLIIETHSEHLILRVLRRIRETAEGRLEEGQFPIKPDDLAVVYAKPTPEGTKLIHLRVTEDGDFADPWPDGFFPERARELL
jgi:hypothetical protein